MFKKFKSHLDKSPKPLSNEATFFSPVPKINAICDNPFQKIVRLLSKVTNGNGGGGAPIGPVPLVVFKGVALAVMNHAAIEPNSPRAHGLKKL